MYLEPCWKRPYMVLMEFCCLVAIVSLPLMVLRFGNPYWNKYIYIFQAYADPGYITGGPFDNWPKFPDGYTGTIYRWDMNGEPLQKGSFVNGIPHGEFVVYAYGKVTDKAHYKMGVLDGVRKWWWVDGPDAPALWVGYGIYRNGKPFKGIFFLDGDAFFSCDNGVKPDAKGRNYFINYQLVSQEEYLKAALAGKDLPMTDDCRLMMKSQKGGPVQVFQHGHDKQAGCSVRRCRP